MAASYHATLTVKHPEVMAPSCSFVATQGSAVQENGADRRFRHRPASCAGYHLYIMTRGLLLPGRGEVW
jgi:hypothetical protein